MTKELLALPNISKAIASGLMQVGIENPEQLISVGSRQAYMLLRRNDKTACFSKLCALEGAIQKTRWHNLSLQTKAELKEFFTLI